MDAPGTAVLHGLEKDGWKLVYDSSELAALYHPHRKAFRVTSGHGVTAIVSQLQIAYVIIAEEFHQGIPVLDRNGLTIPAWGTEVNGDNRERVETAYMNSMCRLYRRCVGWGQEEVFQLRCIDYQSIVPICFQQPLLGVEVLKRFHSIEAYRRIILAQLSAHNGQSYAAHASDC